MEHIRENLEEIRANLPEDVKLIAVTKTYDSEYINEAVACGVTDIGENKVQEILNKYDAVDSSVRWHLIGHLQTNKVKQIIDKVSLIHSVDSMKLAKEIQKRAESKGIIVNILIQVNPAQEESKFGIGTDETEKLIREILDNCPNIRVRGLMLIAPLETDPEKSRPYFRIVKEQYDELGKIDHKNLKFDYLSMGMSMDYKIAVAEGSNMVRIGSSIFGRRQY